MLNTILFGGENREHFVSVASAQAIAEALPETDLWFWGRDGVVSTCDRGVLLGHMQPFEVALPVSGEPIGRVEEALDRAGEEQRLLVLGLHGGMAESGQLAAMCEDRGVPFAGSGSAASQLAFDKLAAKAAMSRMGVSTPPTVSLETAAVALAEHGKLVAKPVADGSSRGGVASYGLLFVESPDARKELEDVVQQEAYLIEPFITGVEATSGVLEHGGELIALPPVKIRPAAGVFDYAAKYLAPTTRELCPAGFSAGDNAALQAAAAKAHATRGARGYSRSDFIVAEERVIFLEFNTLPGLTRASLFPKELAAQGIAFDAFLRGQIELAKIDRR